MLDLSDLINIPDSDDIMPGVTFENTGEDT